MSKTQSTVSEFPIQFVFSLFFFSRESHLTMEPSNALKQVASLQLDENIPSYSSGLGDFLMAGVKPVEQERTMTPSKHKKSGQDKYKLSYTCKFK